MVWDGAAGSASPRSDGERKTGDEREEFGKKS